MNKSNTLIRRAGRAPSSAPARLFCLPPAGAGPSLYYPWLDNGTPFEVCPVSLPGREDRMQESLPESLPNLADELAAGLSNELQRPYALFGYSMGALLAYEIAIRFQVMGLPQPQLLVVLAARAPHKNKPMAQPLHSMQNAEFKDMLMEVGGTPKEIIENDAAMAIFEPILRNDFRISETFQRQSALPLTCPILAIHCNNDVLIEQDDVQAWESCTQSGFEMQCLEQPHIVEREALANIFYKIQRVWQQQSNPLPTL